MRTATNSKYLTPLGVVLALSLGACATATPTGAGPADAAAAESSVVAGGSMSAAGSLPATGSTPAAGASVSSPPSSWTAVSRATVGTGDIPPAPGTVGSLASPPTNTAPPITSDGGIVATPLPDCTPGTLKTMVKGKITFATGKTLSAPWFVGGDPGSGQGYEPAVARAVGKQLGYSSGDIAWITADAARIRAGQAAGFDVALGEFTTPDSSSAPVDYSTGYFSISNSVVAKAGSRTARVRTVNGLKAARVAALAGSPRPGSVRSRLVPTNTTAYPTAATALAALQAGAVDAVVLPTPAAVAAAGVTVIGQLPEGNEQPQQFGMVLAKNSPLTSCVSAAIDQLRITGGLASLVNKWVPAAAKPLG